MKNPNRYSYVVLLAFSTVATTLLLHHPLLAAITITESTPERFSFSWSMDTPDTTTVNILNNKYTALHFNSSNISIENSGEPVTPGYTFTVGVPSSGSVTASFRATATSTVRLAHPPYSVQRTPSQSSTRQISFDKHLHK